MTKRQKNIYERTLKETEYYLSDANITMKQVADKFEVSESTVQRDLSQGLKTIDEELYKKVKEKINLQKSNSRFKNQDNFTKNLESFDVHKTEQIQRTNPKSDSRINPNTDTNKKDYINPISNKTMIKTINKNLLFIEFFGLLVIAVREIGKIILNIFKKH